MPLCQNSPAPLGASSGDYVYTDSGSNAQKQSSFADIDLYRASPDLTVPLTDWACVAPSTFVGATTSPLQSNNFGVSGCFGPPPIPIPFDLRHTISALDETPAALWYPQAVNGSAMFDGTLTMAFPEVLSTGYDVVATQACLDEFINVF